MGEVSFMQNIFYQDEPCCPASFSSGKTPSFKYETIVVVQLLSEPISYMSLESISGES